MLTKTSSIILGLIQQKPLNAYEIVKMLAYLHVKDWCEIADSTVYATLKSLEKKSYITGKIQKDGNMPDKTVYSLTETGFIEIKKSLQTFITKIDYDIVQFMIAGFFIKIFDKAEALNCLKIRLDHLYKYHSGLLEQIEALRTEHLPTYVICNVEHNALIIQTEIVSTQNLIETITEDKEW